MSHNLTSKPTTSLSPLTVHPHPTDSSPPRRHLTSLSPISSSSPKSPSSPITPKSPISPLTPSSPTSPSTHHPFSPSHLSASQTSAISSDNDPEYQDLYDMLGLKRPRDNAVETTGVVGKVAEVGKSVAKGFLWPFKGSKGEGGDLKGQKGGKGGERNLAGNWGEESGVLVEGNRE